MISYGAVLGAEFTVKDGKIVAKRKVKTFPLDRWFLKEELTRDQGNIFFVHTKYLLIDPLSDDPLICTGSANFSENSLTDNDENMILIRGSTRVADIYMTEFDRLFRHFYFRDVANEVAMKRKKGEKPEEGLPRRGRPVDRQLFRAGRIQDASPRDVLQYPGRRLDDRGAGALERRARSAQKEESGDREGKAGQEDQVSQDEKGEGQKGENQEGKAKKAKTKKAKKKAKART